MKIFALFSGKNIVKAMYIIIIKSFKLSVGYGISVLLALQAYAKFRISPVCFLYFIF